MISALLLGLLFALFAVLGANAQEIHNMTDPAGFARQYFVTMPSAAPTGLIVALTPGDIEGAMWFCKKELAEVSDKTGAMVVCPAARIFNSSGPGHPGQPTPCWRSFANYGYCMGGQPEDSQDVDFLAALIERIKAQYTIPEGRTIMSGISNGGSGAYRFNCERSDMIDGLVIGIQAWFDPWVGYFDYVNHRLPTGTPRCKPKKQVPLYSVDGTADWFYGQPPCFPGFESVANWQNYSTEVLGCSGPRTVTLKGPHNFPQGKTECYTYPSCPNISGAGLNVMCEVQNMTHDGSSLGILLPAAFKDFFGAHM